MICRLSVKKPGILECPDCGQIVFEAGDPSSVRIRCRLSPVASGPSRLPPPDEGPGTELTKIFNALGARECWGCNAVKQQMNRWGVSGCQEHRAEIVAAIKANWKKLERRERAAIRLSVIRAVAGKRFPGRVRDPVGSLVDEAVRRSAARGSGDGDQGSET